eukprot:3448247-Amphidinium_carterae.1
MGQAVASQPALNIEHETGFATGTPFSAPEMVQSPFGTFNRAPEDSVTPNHACSQPSHGVRSAEEEYRKWDETDSSSLEPIEVDAMVLRAIRPQAHDGYVRLVVWDPFHNLIVSGGGDCTIRLWDAKSLAFHSQLVAPHLVRSLCVISRGLVSGHCNGAVVFWSATGQEQQLQGHRQPVYAITWLTCGSLVTAAEDL